MTHINFGVQKVIGLIVALVLSLSTAAQAAETATSPEDQLGWKMAIHARTFQKFTVFEAMDKTAALGLKYMSLSAGVNFGGEKPVPVVDLSAEQIQKIKDHAQAKGIKFVNGYVQFPADEAKCRQSFEF